MLANLTPNDLSWASTSKLSFGKFGILKFDPYPEYKFIQNLVKFGQNLMKFALNSNLRPNFDWILPNFTEFTLFYLVKFDFKVKTQIYLFITFAKIRVLQ